VSNNFCANIIVVKRKVSKYAFSLPAVLISIIGLVTVFFLAFPTNTSADGMLIIPDPYSDRWDYQTESNQQAYINYSNGLEKMIISIGTEEATNNAVWIFPVPSSPEKTIIDVVTALPKLRGEKVSILAKSNLDDIKKALTATQIYTIPYVLFSKVRTTSLGETTTPTGVFGALPLGSNKQPDVVVYEHLEKEGITTEVVTAKTAQALYVYLAKKGLSVKTGSIPVLDQYTGKDFTFVVSWLTDKRVGFQPYTQRDSKQKGVYVAFPSSKIYYPLLPTSVYGSTVIPATIRVLGHVSPNIFEDIENYTTVEYYQQDEKNFEEGLADFYSDLKPSRDHTSSRDLKYTKIDIEAPSKLLTEDLWMSPRTPLKTYYSSLFANLPFVAGVLLLLISSAVSGILAGWIVFKDLRKIVKIPKLALLGMSNCLTIIGLAVATVLVGTKNEDERVYPLLNELKQKGYMKKRRLAIALLIVGVPFLIATIVIFPQLISSFAGGGYFIIPMFIMSAMSITLLILAIWIKKVKPEDKDLFVQLKAINYSSWSFHPSDKMKVVFVPLFSVLFLFISWLLIKLVENTV